ncbi:MAG TPA: biotin/lipoyl-binding protein [Gemmataceae bacterium]|nr:biotin/lipoyl-binding protein [Gemmataceae bacterium]
MNTTPRRTRYWWLMGIVLLLGTMASAGWVLNQPATGTGTGNGAKQDPINGVVGLGFVDVEDGITFLHPLQSGRVTAVIVAEGDTVKEGDLILTVDNGVQKANLQAAEAELNAAKRALEDADGQAMKKWHAEIDRQKAGLDAARHALGIAEQELEVAKKGYEQPEYKSVSIQQYEIAKKNVAAKKAVVRGHQAALEQVEYSSPQATIEQARELVKAKQAQYEKASIAFQECDLYAPADGIILRLFATPGEVMSSQPRQAAVQFCSSKPRIIRAEILQEWAHKIQKGQIALVEDDTRNGIQWKGKVDRVSDWFTQRRSILQEPFQYNDVRTLECIIVLEPGGSTVRIGQRVRVIIKQGGP